jgi:hypothetical protein
MTPSIDSPTCPSCQAVLVLGADGRETFWSCPNGHGAACTMTAAYGQLQEDEIKAIWQASAEAEAGSCACPICGTAMVTVSVGVDADEADSGATGDGADTASVTVEVCREDELFWLDAGVIPQLPRDLPNPEPEPTPDEESKLEAVRQTFAAGLEQARLEEKRGFLSRVTESMGGRRSSVGPNLAQVPPAVPAAPAPPEADAPSDQVA